MTTKRIPTGSGTVARLLVSMGVLILVVSGIIAEGYVGEEEPPDLEAIWYRELYNINYIEPVMGGDWAAIGGDFSVKVYLVDVATGATVAEAYTTKYSGNVISEPITGLSSNAEGTLLAIAAGTRIVVVNVPRQEVVWNTSRYDFKYTIHYIRMSDDGSLVIAGSSEVGLVSVAEGRMLWRHERGVGAASFSIPRDEVAVAAGDLLTVYSISTGEVLWEKRFGQRILQVEYSPDGLLLALLLEDGRLLLVEAFDGRKVMEKNLGEKAADARYVSENLLAVLLRNGTIVHLDPANRIILKTLSTHPSFKPARSMVLHPDLESFLVATGEGYAYYANPGYGRFEVTAYPGTIIDIKGRGGSGSWTVGEEGRLTIHATPGEYELTYRFEELPLLLFPFTASPPSDTLKLALRPGETVTVEIPTPFDLLARLTIHGLSPTGYQARIYYGEDLSWWDDIRVPPNGTLDILLPPGKYIVYLRDFGFNKTLELKPGDHVVIDFRNKTTPQNTHAREGKTNTNTSENPPPETTTAREGETQAPPAPRTTESPVQETAATLTVGQSATETRINATLTSVLGGSEEKPEKNVLGDTIRRVDINTILLALIAFLLLVNIIVVSRRRR